MTVLGVLRTSRSELKISKRPSKLKTREVYQMGNAHRSSIVLTATKGHSARIVFLECLSYWSPCEPNRFTCTYHRRSSETCLRLWAKTQLLLEILPQVAPSQELEQVLRKRCSGLVLGILHRAADQPEDSAVKICETVDCRIRWCSERICMLPSPMLNQTQSLLCCPASTFDYLQPSSVAKFRCCKQNQSWS